MIGAARSTVSDVAQEVKARLDGLEQALSRLPDGPDRASLAGGARALREVVDRLDGTSREERRQFGHDLRVPLNAIAGWTHILRLDAASPSTVQRAVDVFDRNVRALTGLIEAYTAETRSSGSLSSSEQPGP